MIKKIDIILAWDVTVCDITGKQENPEFVNLQIDQIRSWEEENIAFIGSRAPDLPGASS